MCIQLTHVSYSVVITWQSNPPISKSSRPCNEFKSVWSMFLCNTNTKPVSTHDTSFGLPSLIRGLDFCSLRGHIIWLFYKWKLILLYTRITLPLDYYLHFLHPYCWYSLWNRLWLFLYGYYFVLKSSVLLFHPPPLESRSTSQGR